MNLGEHEKAALLQFIDSPIFRHACEEIAAKAAARTSFDRPAPDMGVMLARERGVNEFPVLLRELTTPASPETPEGPPLPKALRPITTTLRKS